MVFYNCHADTFSTINDSLHRDLYDGTSPRFVLENCTLNGKSLPVPALNEMRYSYAKNSWIRNQAVPHSSGWLRTVLSMLCRPQDVILFSAGYRACLHKREKTFQRTYLKWFFNRSEIIHRVTSVFQQYFHYSGQPDRLTFLLSLFHASKEETSESLSFTYCPK